MRFISVSLMFVVWTGCASDMNHAARLAHPPETVVAGESGLESFDPTVTVLSPPGSYETTMTINPANPDNAVIAVVDTAGRRTTIWYRTFDGGRTWSGGEAMRVDASNGVTYTSHGDPVLAADRQGRIYFSTLMSQRNARQELRLTTVSVLRSDDGGRTFSPPTIVTQTTVTPDAPFDDKEWMAVDDTGGAYDGSVYLVWQKLERRAVSPSVIYFARSVDGGTTWSQPMPLTQPALSGSSMIDVGADGEIFLGYYRQAERNFVLRVSRDGGASFSAPIPIAGLPSVGGQITGTTLSQRGFPMLHADRSTGPHRGRLYFVSLTAAVLANGQRVSAAGVWRSTDHGQTWSAPVVVSSPAPGDAFFPMAAVDQITGDLVVAWYDRRDSPDTAKARIYVTRSIDGGVTFEPARPLTPPFSIDAPWLGDYYAVAARGGRAFVTFSPASGEMSVVSTRFDAPSLGRGRRRAVRR